VDIVCSNAGIEHERTLSAYGVNGVPFTGVDYNVPACRLTGSLIGGAAWGDGDGSDMTAYIPYRDMAKGFIIPFKTQHVAVVCDDAAIIDFYKRTQFGPQLLESVTAAAPSKEAGLSGPHVSMVYRNSGPVLDEGVIIVTSTWCHVLVDSVINSGDEVTIFGSPKRP
jgi:hypothetical protein